MHPKSTDSADNLSQGIGFSGSTICDAGTTCIKLNDYYSQCQPGAAAPPPPVTTTPASPPPSQTGAPKPAATGLDKAFKAKGKVFFGTAADSNRFNNPTDSAVTIREFGGLTPENSMKWDAVSHLRIPATHRSNTLAPHRLSVSYTCRMGCCRHGTEKPSPSYAQPVQLRRL